MLRQHRSTQRHAPRGKEDKERLVADMIALTRQFGRYVAIVNKMLVMELARCDCITRNENIIAVGNSGTGKTHIGLGLGLAACQKGLAVGFITASALVHELLEARDEKRLLRLQKQLSKYSLLIIDELGYVPLSPTGAELLFEVFSTALRAWVHHRDIQPAVR